MMSKVLVTTVMGCSVVMPAQAQQVVLTPAGTMFQPAPVVTSSDPVLNPIQPSPAQQKQVAFGPDAPRINIDPNNLMGGNWFEDPYKYSKPNPDIPVQKPLLPGEENIGMPDPVLVIDPTTGQPYTEKGKFDTRPDRVMTDQERRESARLRTYQPTIHSSPTLTTTISAPTAAIAVPAMTIAAPTPASVSTESVTVNPNLRVMTGQSNDSPLSTSRVFPISP